MSLNIISSIAVVFGIALVVVGVVLYTSTGGKYFPFNDYGITIDASSSNALVTLYKWGEDKRVKEIDSCKTGHAITSFGEDTEKVVESILPCFTSMVAKVNKTPDETPVILGATAGMRILEKTDKVMTQKIFKALDVALKNVKSENTTLNVEYPRVISGKDEGLYGWIAANYLMDIIPPEHKISANGTVGTLDLGGASAQIAFEAPLKMETAEATLFGETYHVKTYSNLCYGMDQARLRYQYLLIKNYDDKSGKAIPDPCANKGLDYEKSGADFVDQYCLESPQSNHQREFVSAKTVYKFTGTAEESTCIELIGQFTNAMKCAENFEICAVINTGGTPKNMSFVAVSNFYYVTRAIDYLLDHSSISLKQFESGITSFCAEEWNIIEKDVNKYCHTSVDKCKNYCFGLYFIKQTLEDIYEFDEDQWTNIHFVKKIDGEDMEWSLGDMLVTSNAMPVAKAVTPPVLPMYAMIILVIAGAIMLVAGVAHLCKRHVVKRNYESV